MIPTKLTAALVATTLLASSPAGSATAVSILFIGNSFTFAAGSAVHFYRADTVTDLNGEGIGGVPALFESFTRQAGLDYEVSLETRGGSGLDFHLAEKADVIRSRAWDKVVMHGYSTLDAAKPRDPAKLIATSARMAALLREKNPKVEIYLMATWSRADQIYPAKGAWAGTAVDVMARDVRAAYDKAAREAAATAVIPVGEAWTRAIQAGVADANPYDGIEAGKLDLWTYDHYHASTYGSYLEALVVFGAVTGRDPRSLGDAECSGFELGLSRPQVAALQQVAFDQLAAGGTVSAAPPPAKAGAPVALHRRALAVGERRDERRRGGVGRRLERHRLVVVEELGADAVEGVGGVGAPDLVQERRRHALAEEVDELLHPVALHLLRLVEGGLRLPQGADVLPHVAPGRPGQRLAAQLLPDLVEQPGAADGAAPDHQAAAAGPLEQRPRLRRRVDVAVGDDGAGHRVDRLANQVVVHGRPVHLRHRPRVHGERVDRVPGEDRQQPVELLRRGETEAGLHRERDRHRLAQRAQDGVDALALPEQAAAGALPVDDRRRAAQVQVDGGDGQLLERPSPCAPATGTSLPISCATTGRPVVFWTIESTIHFSGVESPWTRKYSVQ